MATFKELRLFGPFTTTERDALVSGGRDIPTYTIILNSTTNRFEFWTGAAWKGVQLDGSITSSDTNSPQNYTFNYTGSAGASFGLAVTTTYVGSGVTPVAFGVQLNAGLGSGSNAANLIVLQLKATESNLGTVNEITVLNLENAVIEGNNATIIRGIQIEDQGDSVFPPVTLGALIIEPQTAASSATYNIWQQGTVGVNVLAAATLVGSNNQPSNATFQVSGGSVSPAAGANARVASIAGTLVEAGSGTHSRLMGLEVTAPTITPEAATVTDAATVYVSNATGATATRDHALWVDDGVSRFDGGIRLAAASTLYTTSNLTSGVYTPTLTNVANLDASTAYECQFMCLGSTVNVSGKVDVDPTLTATATQLGISLPIASNFGAQEDCAGTAFASGIAAQGAAIRGDAANDRAEMVWIAGDVTNQPMYFTFQYQVI